MRFTGKTKMAGIIGYPLGHSLSPLMQNAAFRARGLDWCYVPLELPPRHLKRTVPLLPHLGFSGFNVTVPHKEKIIPFLDHLSREARFLGAVNTVLVRRGRLIGYNTDAEGFSRALKSGSRRTVRRRRVLITGAGGAARAVAFQMAREGAAQIVIVNRSTSRGRRLAAALRGAFPRCAVSVLPLNTGSFRKAIPAADFIVNASSLGMSKNRPLLLPAGVLRPSHTVCDLVYRPVLTPLLRQAGRAGAGTVDGLGMLIHQGALAFEIWTGQKAPIRAMKEAIIDITN